MKQRKSNLDNETEPSPEDARQVALNLLARREHSRLEMQHKLSRRGFAPAVIEDMLERLSSEDLLNEQRYAEVYAHSRADKGYGPVRVQLELRERGVPADIIATILTGLEAQWMAKLVAVQRKRFGALIPKDAAGLARQMRFLRQRGFTSDQINRLFKLSSNDDHDQQC